MNLDFDDPRLQRLVESERRMLKECGKERTERLKNRLSQLRAAATFTDLRPLPGHWHPLVRDWAGHWSGDLDQPYRLIVRPTEPVPLQDDDSIDWSACAAATVVTIDDTHN